MYTDTDRRVLSAIKKKRSSFNSLMNKNRLDLRDEMELEQMFMTE